jgi:peptidoglycan/xylan/chitin deacetylase (PgdA/CDA1 family)
VSVQIEAQPLRIPVTMCHGTNRGPFFSPAPRWRERPPLHARHFEGLMQIASELGFRSISYDELAAWRAGEASMPERPIMFDFDHPNRSIYYEIWPMMRQFGYRGNLFINTAAMEKLGDRRYMTWDDVRDLVSHGWHIGAHLHHHINLAYLAKKDPSGALIRDEMDTCDRIIQKEIGIAPADFAYTATTWSAVAEVEVKRRYRFGRLWIIGASYDTEAGRIRYADLAGVAGEDEADGGPPMAARYITRDSDPYRLPSMDFEYLIYEHAAFRRYLEGAMVLDDAIASAPL